MSKLDGWRKKFEAKEWSWFYGIEAQVNISAQDVRYELKEILERIRKLVGRVKDENGMQVTWRYRYSEEVPSNLRILAEILELGELEASIYPEPQSTGQRWIELRKEVQTALNKFLEADEVTEGSSALSRRGHAATALDHFKALDVATTFLKLHMRDLTADEMGENELEHWANEAAAEIALPAFRAGQFATYADYKAMEKAAVTGEKVAGGARNSAHGTNIRYVQEREKRLEMMCEYLDQGKTVAEASRLVAQERGSTAAAEKKNWQRHGAGFLAQRQKAKLVGDT